MADELEVDATYEEFEEHDDEGLCWYKCRWTVCGDLFNTSQFIVRHD